MKLKALTLHLLALLVLCFGGCAREGGVVESEPLSAEDLEAIGESFLLELSIPSQDESLFESEEPSAELKRKIYRAGGSLVQNGRLLLTLHNWSYEFSAGQPALFTPFDKWVKQHGIEEAHIWIDGGEMEIIGFNGSPDEPIGVDLIGNELMRFDRLPPYGE
jgi:hypothetical protein